MTPALPTGCVIALLGAEGSGKTALAHALVQRLLQRGLPGGCVPDLLHEWREREGGMPQANDLAAIAAEQSRRLADAAARGVVIADTTALMTAIHSLQRFGDASLHADAIAAQRRYALTLLLASSQPTQTETLLRTALVEARLPFSVIHGEGAERLPLAWEAIRAVADPEGDAQAAPGRRTWAWTCDKCSDPACEHRLFSELVANRR
jgi:nicotinamide riboside kinase